EIGTAHHLFLQLVSLAYVGDRASLLKEADRLEQEQLLTSEQRGALDLKALAAFWESEIGQKIRTNRKQVQRELPFTARFRLEEVADLTTASEGEALDED